MQSSSSKLRQQWAFKSGLSGDYWTPLRGQFSANGTIRLWLLHASSFSEDSQAAVSPGKTSCGLTCLCPFQREMNHQDGTKLVILANSVLGPSFYKNRGNHFILLLKSKICFPLGNLKFLVYFVPDRSSNFSKVDTFPGFRQDKLGTNGKQHILVMPQWKSNIAKLTLCNAIYFLWDTF